MENKNLISIIVPVYNRPKLVAECLDSVLAQTNPNWVCFVVDDGSTDNTWDVLEEYAAKDERIRIFKRDREPKGAPTCRNIGLNFADSNWVLFLDSDDLLAPWAIEERLKHVNNEIIDLLVFKGIEFNNTNLSLRKQRANFSIKDLLNYHIHYQVAWQTACALWNRKFLNKIGGWYEYAMSSQDSVLNLIALYEGAIHKWGSPLPDVFIRTTPNFSKISNTNSIEKIRSRLKTINYIKSKLKDSDYKIYEHYFLHDLINRLELLENNTLKLEYISIIREIAKLKKVRGLTVYFFLYTLTREIKFIHGIIYRMRNYVTNFSRIKNIRNHSKIDEKIFNELREKAKQYPSITEKVWVLK